VRNIFFHWNLSYDLPIQNLASSILVPNQIYSKPLTEIFLSFASEEDDGAQRVTEP
jgi:hypothetical protein